MGPTAHVIGAGLSGLAAALWLGRSGWPVRLYEASGHAGGRCRSFHDTSLDRAIDNGNHLVLSGNREVNAFLSAVGAADELTGPARAEYTFVDVSSGERWTVRPGAGPLPWWILSQRRRVPGTRWPNYLKVARLAWASRDATVADCLDGRDALFARFWEPLAVAVLNARADKGAAALLRPVVVATFGRGEAACRPRMARRGLSDCFVAPALTALADAGATVTFRRRLRALDLAADAVSALRFADGEAVEVAARDAVVVATPPAATSELVPGLTVPMGSNAIVNGHFLLERSIPETRMIGLVGGFCHWIFTRDDVASVTISAADDLVDHPNEVLAARMWPEICQALELGERPLPPHRIIKEKRATFAQVSANIGRRPGVRTGWRNLFLAGDWTETGLPATIEGSLQSGHSAAAAVLATAVSS